MRLLKVINATSSYTYMTPTRTRTRVYKYIILVNTVGAIVGAELSYLYFIYKKQLFSPVIWRTDSPPNTYLYVFSCVHFSYILLNISQNHNSTSPYAFIAVPIKPCYFRGTFMVTSSDERTNYAKETK